jgi:hypothetical protein
MDKRQKTGGRQKGTPNHLTKDLRQRISDFLAENWEGVQEDFDSLEPKERLAFYEKLLSYSLPKLLATEISTEKPKEEKIQAVINWGGREIRI